LRRAPQRTTQQDVSGLTCKDREACTSSITAAVWGTAMPNTIRKVSYAYVEILNKSGELARILSALRDANVNLLAFSGFPQGRTKAQLDLFTDDLNGLKAVARQQKWKLSRIKRCFLVQGTDEIGAAVPPLNSVANSKINLIASYAIAAGKRRFGMLFWVEPRDYNRAARQLGAG
jgi:hypothetical protein